MQYAQLIGYYLFTLILLLCWAWAVLALYISGPEPSWWRYSLIILFIASLVLAHYLEIQMWQRSLLLLALFSVILAWWISLTASNNKDWTPDLAKIPYGRIEQDNLILHNVRNFSYTSRYDFSERWQSRQYNLSKLESLDLYLSYWSSEHIAHVIMSWGFSNGDHLAMSIETRKDKSQTYSALKGFFKQYTLAYVVSDETDLIKLRTHYRKERVYRYRIENISQEYKRHLLESYVTHMNKLIDKPEFYHALFQNCTSGINHHYKTFMPKTTWIDWRLIADGHLDELLYDIGLINTELPFAEMRQQARVDLKMQKYTGTNYSAYLREK